MVTYRTTLTYAGYAFKWPKWLANLLVYFNVVVYREIRSVTIAKIIYHAGYSLPTFPTRNRQIWTLINVEKMQCKIRAPITAINKGLYAWDNFLNCCSGLWRQTTLSLHLTVPAQWIRDDSTTSTRRRTFGQRWVDVVQTSLDGRCTNFACSLGYRFIWRRE